MTPDTPTPTVTLAEFAHGAPREAAPLTPVPAVAPAAIHTVEEAAAALSAQYRYAVDGLYEAYRFGLILLVVKRYLEWKGAGEGEGAARPLDPAPAQGAGPRPAPVGAGFVDAEMGEGHDENDAETEVSPCESARGPAKIEDELRGGWNRGTEVSPCESARGPAKIIVGNNGNEMVCAGGWNRGTGLKAWLARYCPEINYSTAKRFLAVAERTHAALAAASDPQASGASGASPSDSPSSQSIWGPAPCAGAGEGARSPFPPEAARAPSEAGTPFAIPTFPEATVRAFLEGKSQRAVLRLGGARAGAGRPRKDWAAALGTSPEAAMKRLEEALAPLNELIVVKGTHRLLAAADLETVRAAVALLAARLAEAE